MSEGIVTLFTRDHGECDDRWAELEDRIDRGEGVAEAWARFDHAMRRHLAMEEEVLFPAFEEATGMRDVGPTAVMRSEHVQMRAVLDGIGQAVAAGRHADALSQGDTLLMLIQQHNVKEEGMLYPMAERVIGDGWPALRSALDRFLAE